MTRPFLRSPGLRWRPPLAPPGVLHHLGAVLSLGLRQPQSEGGGAQMRRRRQRLAMAQRLLDPLPEGLCCTSRRNTESFWQALRWGGLGLLLAWLLQR
ncbi:MAG: hypothetical protein WCH37_01910 [Synechococcaceae cyanobacterium ELA182]